MGWFIAVAVLVLLAFLVYVLMSQSSSATTAASGGAGAGTGGGTPAPTTPSFEPQLQGIRDILRLLDEEQRRPLPGECEDMRRLIAEACAAGAPDGILATLVEGVDRICPE